MAESVRVLHVDDDPDFSDLVESFLESRKPHFEIVTAMDANVALNRLTEWGVECIISDYQMPKMDGLEFLEAIRGEMPSLPFILFTGKGSEEIAADAITAGVTDYIQKGSHEDTYALLANRIENAVKNYRNKRELQLTQTRLRLLVEESTDAIYIVSRDGTIEWVNPVTSRILGRTAEETIGSYAFDHVHPRDVDRVKSKFEALNERPRSKVSARFRIQRADGEMVDVEARGRNLTNHPAIGGNVVYLREYSGDEFPPIDGSN